MSRRSPRWWLWPGICLILVVGGLFLYRTLDVGRSSVPRLSEGGLPTSGSLAGANVLIITLDTVRADRYGCYGSRTVYTPALDGLANDGVLFTRTTAVTPITLPSHTSIMTGLYPRRHGVRANGYFSLDEQHVTMAEVLQDAGYETGAVLASFVLTARFGLDQGFDDYDDDLQPGDQADPMLFAERKANDVTDRALAWLADRDDRPFMLWVHYFDPHAPYDPPQRYRQTYADRPYDGEIAYTDAEMGRLLDGLARLGLADDTIVVAVGDHGEALHEKDEPTHAYLLYEGTMHVPMVMWCGQRLGGGIERTDRVSQVDILPTVLALLGIEPPSTLDGVDLASTTATPRVFFGETYEGKMEHGWAALFSAYEDDAKYIHGPHPELYDLKDDGRERNDIRDEHPDRVTALYEQLADHFGEELDSSTAPTPSRSLSPQEQARLRSLGYTVSSSQGAPRSGQGADPRRMMRLMSRVDQVVFGKPPEERGPEVAEELEAILQEHPTFVPGFRYLGILRRNAGDHQGAVDALSHAVSLHPEATDLRLTLADSRARSGDTRQAIADLDTLIAMDPDNARAHLILGRLWLSSGEPDAALAPLRTATELDPDQPGCAESLEQAYANAGHSAELLPFLDAMLADRPASSTLRKAKAHALFREGRADEADDVLREGLRLAPDDPLAVETMVLFLIGRPDTEGKRVAEAVALIDGLPDEVVRTDASLLLTVGKLQGARGQLDEALTASRQALDLAQQGRRHAVARDARQFIAQVEKTRRRTGR